MKLTLRVYVNSDDALLLWTADKLDPTLSGFAIQRRRTRPGSSKVTDWIDNYAPPGTQAHQLGVLQGSNRWPFRSFTWTDHSVGEGDKVQYRVVPMLAGDAAPREALASAWSGERTVGYPDQARYRGYFNRGFIISQFMSRYLDEHYPDAKNRDDALARFKKDITNDLEDRIRIFLSGQIRTQLLGLLDEIDAKGDEHVYAALFELEDTQLIEKLAKLGPRAHVVLANGSIQVKKDKNGQATETTAEARKRDENEAARATLLHAQVDVEATNRFVSPGALGHNKFLVRTDSAENALSVWTGSTNWTTTGLCTQLNNALLVDDGDVASAYLAQWKALRNAGSGHPAGLAQGNGTPTQIGQDAPRALRSSVHFTRADKRVDLEALAEIVDGANEGVLFLMFMPGGSGVLKAVEELKKSKPDLVIRGVVSELPKGLGDEQSGPTTTLKVKLVDSSTDGAAGTKTVDVVQPEGRANPTAWWAAETTHQQFTHDIGFAIIHSKVLVVDPFSTDPTVVTGSHNFSISASENNDENFIVVHGDPVLAEAYAVNVDSAWRHYAARIAMPHPDLKGIDYLNALLDDRRADEHFWRLTA